MKIDDALIEDLAKLSKLRFDALEREEIKDDLSKMLAFVEQLNDVDTEGVEPLIYLTEGAQEAREDIVDDSYTQEQALKNAPQKDSDYFKVPKFLSKDRDE